MKRSGQHVAFVSYASENREKAEEICASLERRGVRCWIAPRDVRAGHEYTDEIMRGIEESAALVLVLSEAANTSLFVSREVERAVAKAKPLFPVRIEEVTPKEGLELLISGDQWIDAWTGGWDDHMDRLARDLLERVRGTPAARTASRDRPLVAQRSFAGLYAGLALLIVVGGLAIWSFSGEARPRQVATPVRVDDRPARSVRDQPATAPRQRETGEIPTTKPAATTRPAERAGTPSSPPLVGQNATALSALRDAYDDLSLRGGVVDDTLNQLWEEMKPAAPRLDMVTSQRRLKASLARGQDALAKKDAAGARKYLDLARTDLEVLEQFLNR